VSLNRPISNRPNREFAGSHQRSWLWGHHAVLETLAAGRWPVIELFADPQLPAEVLQKVRAEAAVHRLQVQAADSHRLEQLCRQPDHQGLVARMGEFPCESMETLQSFVRSLPLQTPPENGNPPLFVLCDRLQDAHNFGAILRCCDAVRADGVIIGEREQVMVTPHVARASSGAVNHLRLFRTASLIEAVHQFQSTGYQIIAASEKSSTLLWDTPLRGPLVLVIGSEARGIDTDLLARCTVRVAIPMLGEVASLNAAVAAGILLYECRRQNPRST